MDAIQEDCGRYICFGAQRWAIKKGNALRNYFDISQKNEDADLLGQKALRGGNRAAVTKLVKKFSS